MIIRVKIVYNHVKRLYTLPLRHITDAMMKGRAPKWEKKNKNRNRIASVAVFEVTPTASVPGCN